MLLKLFIHEKTRAHKSHDTVSIKTNTQLQQQMRKHMDPHKSTFAAVAVYEFETWHKTLEMSPNPRKVRSSVKRFFH